MLPENRALLLIGSLYWIGLFVLVNGVAASVIMENHSIAAGSLLAALVIWIVGTVVGVRGKDKYGSIRSGIDRGR